METLELYRLAQDRFDTVLTAVDPDRWEARSACEQWSVRDVAGHVIWGQHQVRAWATGTDYDDRRGAPGSPHPAVLTGPDPVATWRAARADAVATLTPEALARTTSIPGMGEVPVAALIALLTVDHVAHGWDIAYPLGMQPRIEPELVAMAFDWARAHVLRRPGFFGAELTAPDGADEQTRMLAFLGRNAWQRVPA
ncbi:TIGR03086 family protein [Amycolatopsis sp. K13G38]|uniref:TIGR03086 family protein n=1 Tax=Amycolatopsis acididurans TaxID=2724524 RepID=A0ABX1J4T7_9PSEU|nr:TIGR03086 family metal-binding protein [Amycolatopsis acididurans]NKQ54807.1 TIGR03086 family protein [Amycolatopsis acididurans]